MKAGFSNQITCLALPSLSFLLTIFYFVYQKNKNKKKEKQSQDIYNTYIYIQYIQRERFFLGTGYAVVGAGKSEVHRAGQKSRQGLTLQSRGRILQEILEFTLEVFNWLDEIHPCYQR